MSSSSPHISRDALDEAREIALNWTTNEPAIRMASAYLDLFEQFERFRSAVECEFASEGRTQAEVDSIMAWLGAPMRQNG